MIMSATTSSRTATSKRAMTRSRRIAEIVSGAVVPFVSDSSATRLAAPVDARAYTRTYGDNG